MTAAKTALLLGMLLLAFPVASIHGAEDERAAKLAAESEAYCAETMKDADTLTPRLIIDKVDEAARLIAEQGEAAFPMFRGKDSPFIFCGTYIWVHDAKGVMRMHPIKHRMEGLNVLALRDRKGKRFFVEMNETVEKNGAGWVRYDWPKPGEREVSPKVSYVKGVTYRGETFIVGCGVYDMTLDDVKKALEQDDQPAGDGDTPDEPDAPASE